MSEKKITKEEIFRVIWSACDTFRGVLASANYMNYILGMLFVKYLSDVWKEHKEEYQKRFENDRERVERRMGREKFIIPEESQFDYLYSKRNEINVGEILNKGFQALEEANHEKLTGVFGDLDFNSEAKLGEVKDRNKRLKSMLEDFANPVLDLRPSRIEDMDVIGDAYEYLISQFADDSGKKGGEFYTPQEVAEVLARILKAQSGDRIYDPTVGSGSLLLRVASRIEGDNYSLYGQEVKSVTWALCKMNMYLHDIKIADIRRGDTIRSPKFINNGKVTKFDVVVANPPFSLKKWGHDDVENDQFDRFRRGMPPQSKGDFAFILQMIESANEHGKVGVVVPHGVLFRGAAEGRIRQKLIEENLLDAVIGLPSNLFFGTGIPAALMIFKKGRKRKDVLFIDASRGFEKNKNQNRLRPEDIDKICEAYEARKFIDKYAYVADMEEIKKNEFNLNIPRYVDTFEEEDIVDVAAIQKEIDDIESELAEIKKKMKAYMNELGILE